MKRFNFFILIFLLLLLLSGSLFFYLRPKEKVLAIGIDGGTFDIILPLINDGELPNIKKLINSGVSGKLVSINQPIFPAAWTTFATGKEQGETGIYDHLIPISNSYDFRLISPNDLKSQTVWDILTAVKKKVGIINLLFYPAPKVNGFFISGELTPADKLSEISDATYPKKLSSEIEEKIGEYRIDVKGFKDEESFLKDINYVLDQRARTGVYLFKKYNLDFFNIIFSETNRIQHFFWKYNDPNSPEYNPNGQYSDVIKEHYKKLDKIVGQFLEIADKNTTVILFSNSGFGPLYKTVSINVWLEKLNLLVKSGTESEDSLFSEKIDWSKTKAFFPSKFQGIFINKIGKYPQGTVSSDDYENLREEIIQKVLEIKDPETGQNVIKNALKKEDVYSGPYLDIAPDIILIWQRGYLGSNELSGSVVKKSDFWSGIHNREGMYIISGKNIKPSQKDARLIDLLPTILNLLKVKIPDDMEGESILP